jgi:hypothetical protein
LEVECRVAGDVVDDVFERTGFAQLL